MTSSTQPEQDTHNNLPEKCQIRDWQARWQRAKDSTLRYDGIYTYTASDDIVDSETLISLGDDDNNVNAEPIVEAAVALTVVPTGMGFTLSGTVNSVVPILHPQTLEAIDTPLSFDVTERFLITDQLPKEYADEEWVAQHSDENEAYGRLDWVDLKDWVRQWIVLKTGEVVIEE